MHSNRDYGSLAAASTEPDVTAVEEKPRRRGKCTRCLGKVKTTVDAVAYFSFLILFSIGITTIRDPTYGFPYNQWMRDALLTNALPLRDQHELVERPDFNDVHDVRNFWLYLRNNYINAIQGVGAGHNNIAQESVLVGSVQIRQLRVAPKTCEVVKEFQQTSLKNSNCFGIFAPDAQATDSFGGGQGFNYTVPDPPDFPVAGKLQNYDSNGGYYVSFYGVDSDFERLDRMKDDGFIDYQTRVVTVSLNAYNPNTNLFFSGVQVIEFPPSGGIVTDVKFRSILLFRYLPTTRGRLTLVMDIVILSFIGFDILRELFKMFYYRLKYLKHGWNYYSLFVIFIFLGVLFVRIKISALTNKMQVATSAKHEFLNFTEITDLNDLMFHLLSFNALLLWGKMFVYLEFSRQSKYIVRTLAFAVKDLGAFMVVSAFIFIGFAYMGQLAFGDDIHGFSTLSNACFTLLQLLLGYGNFEAMYVSSPVMAGIYYTVFTGLFSLVLINMFVAVLTATYARERDRVDEDIKRTKEALLLDDVTNKTEAFWRRVLPQRMVRWIENAAQVIRMARARSFAEELEEIQRDTPLPADVRELARVRATQLGSLLAPRDGVAAALPTTTVAELTASEEACIVEQMNVDGAEIEDLARLVIALQTKTDAVMQVLAAEAQASAVAAAASGTGQPPTPLLSRSPSSHGT